MLPLEKERRLRNENLRKEMNPLKEILIKKT